MRSKIMIIDDEERICKALADFLEDYDEFEIRFAHSAEDALNQLRHKTADVCVLDLRLPEMNGLDLVKILVKERLCLANIIYTASLNLENIYDITSLGISLKDIIHKPTDNFILLEKIRSALKNS
jgi:DNA-binding NtrC family response regulator